MRTISERYQNNDIKTARLLNLGSRDPVVRFLLTALCPSRSITAVDMCLCRLTVFQGNDDIYDLDYQEGSAQNPASVGPGGNRPPPIPPPPPRTDGPGMMPPQRATHAVPLSSSVRAHAVPQSERMPCLSPSTCRSSVRAHVVPQSASV